MDGLPVPGMKAWCRSAAGIFDLVVCSARFVQPDQFKYAHDFLMEQGFPPMALVWEKPLALWYIDDRAIRFAGPGTLPDPASLLTRKVWYEDRVSSMRFKGTSGE